MHLAKVLGSVTASAQAEGLGGLKIMLVQPLGVDRRPEGDPHLAVDFAQAGPGDTVLALREGGAARLLLGQNSAPIHAAIVGVVDEVDLGGG
jgi:ethanolamine utilization protein EutN